MNRASSAANGLYRVESAFFTPTSLEPKVGTVTEPKKANRIFDPCRQEFQDQLRLPPAVMLDGTVGVLVPSVHPTRPSPPVNGDGSS